MKSFVFLMVALGLVGCGDDTATGGSGGSGASGGDGGSSDGGASTGGGGETSTGGGGEATGGGGGGQGGASQSGDCDDAADCTPDGQCVELTPGGFRVCQYPIVEATECIDNKLDQCCDTTECGGAGELCLTTPIVPYCGGAQMLDHNECASDLCDDDSDCEDSICVPAGTVGNKVKMCVFAACRTDADCPGAICAPAFDPCCGGPMGLYCIEDGVNCRRSADCDKDEFCGLNEDGVPVCQTGGPTCPA